VKLIVPCYKYGRFLGDCVDSILNQEGVETRVLIVDDCSPDDSAQIAGRIAESDDRVEFRRHEHNMGLIPTANEGLTWAEDGDYTVIISADDLLVPGALARATSIMEERPNVGLVYGRAVQFASGETPPGPGNWGAPKVWADSGWVRLPIPRPGRWRGTRVWSGEDWIRIRCRSGHGCISSPEAVVRTSVQRSAGAYDPACGHAAEVNMWLRVAAISDVAYVKGAAQALYRIHTNSMYRTLHASGSGPIVDFKDRREAFARFFDNDEGNLSDRGGQRRLAMRTLARQALWRASRAYDQNLVDPDDGVSASEYVAFALESYPEARDLREWRGLRLREKLGAGRSLWFPLFLATGVAHRLGAHLSRMRLHALGV
jgi:glycosyltransferase involved in cell wall biosynthesis